VTTHTLTARTARGDIDVDRVTSTDPDLIRSYLDDAAHYPGGHASTVGRPRSEADVAALLTASNRVLPVGDQSSLTGGATPVGGTVLSTEALDKVVLTSQSEIRVQAGVSLRLLQDTLDRQGAFYPPVPTYDGATAGGVVATNAAGAATFKYGSTRDWVRGLTVVLADGGVLDLKRGEVMAHEDGFFEISSCSGRRRVDIPAYNMPDVPKRSAGYYAAPKMDVVDLFIGSEGTLGVVTDVTFAVLPHRPPSCLFWLPLSDEREAFTLVTTLRATSQATRESQDPSGIDVAAIEHLDRRSLEIVREDGAHLAAEVTIPDDTHVGLFIQLELPQHPSLTSSQAYEQIANALEPATPDTPLVRICRVFDSAGVLGRVEVALPNDRRRRNQLLAMREAVPEGVNRRVDAAKRVEPGIHKTAADMIAPFDRFEDCLSLFRNAFAERGLDYAIWGHISDGNVHPNVIPTGLEDVTRGQAAILECGRSIITMGGCPMAEHGVGRNGVKQALLRDLYGEEGIRSMRKIKAALDPDWRLAPGVLFPEAPRP
jgi:D-lactate dehydrogenase (cytochrome)